MLQEALPGSPSTPTHFFDPVLPSPWEGIQKLPPRHTFAKLVFLMMVVCVTLGSELC